MALYGLSFSASFRTWNINGLLLVHSLCVINAGMRYQNQLVPKGYDICQNHLFREFCSNHLKSYDAISSWLTLCVYCSSDQKIQSNADIYLEECFICRGGYLLCTAIGHIDIFEVKECFMQSFCENSVSRIAYMHTMVAWKVGSKEAWCLQTAFGLKQ